MSIRLPDLSKDNHQNNKTLCVKISAHVSNKQAPSSAHPNSARSGNDATMPTAKMFSCTQIATKSHHPHSEDSSSHNCTKNLKKSRFQRRFSFIVLFLNTHARNFVKNVLQHISYQTFADSNLFLYLCAFFRNHLCLTS